MKALVLIFICFLSVQSYATTYNILDFGAKADDKFINTAAINEAVTNVPSMVAEQF